MHIPLPNPPPTPLPLSSLLILIHFLLDFHFFLTALALTTTTFLLDPQLTLLLLLDPRLLRRRHWLAIARAIIHTALPVALLGGVARAALGKCPGQCGVEVALLPAEVRDAVADAAGGGAWGG